MKPGRAAALIVAGCLWLAGCTEAPPPSAAPFDHQHTLLDQVLQKHVENGLVDYRALQADQETLNRYLQTLAGVDPKAYDDWTRQQKLAFWINAYNAHILRVILDHYPVTRSIFADPLCRYPDNSIRQIFGVWGWRWWPALGDKYTFDHMEHVILRQELIEPRIHFVLVCASIGCPLLESRAFDAEHLESRLDQAAVNYLYRDRKVQIDKAGNAVRLPQIFNWFAGDFTPDPQTAVFFEHYPREAIGPLTWVYRYANAADREFLRQGKFELTYLEYDWALNDRR
ncbi:MAG: hypothetical protein A3E57_02180 [Candidatus Muproteobacteria bacterium RIFCSPHIGHO2_12_FULL_60_33]|uniref:DUF547 domain-containing protein n=1 Tax=Candidatus Muproteobacteria bacterium RIFCSPLOWO2_01_FULL_60_18 TaxID=1817768 RepID=A0A1F6TZ91_9PROT|nr:MAG: hypothetical protein A2W42_03720 [Candidatus Muproteobacteria bacterium RIFCSPHIGHO2_01_60_12]OGI50433.1 MAG: hypothetical protein A3A87_09515 [Candidatus Muproteobacteria bacterium RIFCSPLOWO2_01_FULL_60_18]OGI54000.1 MAG: hypothetical protein A3D32_04345 [Candidatus Muproteobacteria bacterium RIFCSPHIGHO2_02_FULL_60_13]OGI55972.1 MAG: hypothetical protein A3E57_02180 [Candidatus Muproteobacteria bacterium RIFCSPHIGHO2_12_FULL_60_33]